MEGDVLILRRENGRSITARSSRDRVALIVWRKNQSPLLPLVLDADEAESLRDMLTQAIKDANA